MSAYNFKTFLENLKNPQAKACLTEDAVETEQEPVKYAEEMKHHQKLIQAVKNSCSCDTDEEAWEEILGARQSMAENIACDPERQHEYLHWALEDLGLELDYVMDFLDVPYDEPDISDDEDDEYMDIEDNDAESEEKEPISDIKTRYKGALDF